MAGDANLRDCSFYGDGGGFTASLATDGDLFSFKGDGGGLLVSTATDGDRESCDA